MRSWEVLLQQNMFRKRSNMQIFLTKALGKKEFSVFLIMLEIETYTLQLDRGYWDMYISTLVMIGYDPILCVSIF